MAGGAEVEKFLVDEGDVLAVQGDVVGGGAEGCEVGCCGVADSVEGCVPCVLCVVFGVQARGPEEVVLRFGGVVDD